MLKARRLVPAGATLCGLVTLSCLDFHAVGPEDPAPLFPPSVVSVTIEYTQPLWCANAPERCNDPVVFFGSWMQPGAAFPLTRELGGYVYRGTALAVPINFPPHEYEMPYDVRVFDPRLVGLTGGGTGFRIKVGGELLFKIENPGSSDEYAQVYVDSNGQGRNPYY